MKTELGGSQLDDPFRRSSLLSFLPKTLGPLSHDRSAVTGAQDLESVDKVLKFMVTTAATKAHEVESIKTVIKSMDHPLERRPAMGRKRAKFNLKPVPSPSLPDRDIISSIDHIDDPEEYFSAFEQLENAEKEMKKLRGEVSTDTVQTSQLTTARQRRPGILGKRASYTHHISTNVDTSETFVASQEEHLNGRTSGSSNASTDTGLHNLFRSEPVSEPGTSQAENTNREFHDATESEGSVVENEKNVSNLLGKLLSCYGDEGEALLRESLQMKSIDKGKFCLPELENILLSQRSALKNRVAVEELKGSLISPPLTKSLLGTISALQRQNSLNDPLKDLYFGFLGDKTPCSRDSFLSKSAAKLSASPVGVPNHDGSDFLFDGASSHIEENDIRLHFENDNFELDAETCRFIDNNIITKEKSAEHCNPLHDSTTNPDSNMVQNHEGSRSVGFDGGSQEDNYVHMGPVTTDEPYARVEGPDLKSSKQPHTQEVLEVPSQLLGENTNCGTTADDKNKNVAGCLDGGLQTEDLLVPNQPVACIEVPPSIYRNQTATESLASPPSNNMAVSCTRSGINFKTAFTRREDVSQSEVDGRVQENVSDAGTSKGNSWPSESTSRTDQHLEKTHSLLHEDNEEHQTTSRPPSNRNMKRKDQRRTLNTKKSTLRRQSLAGAGMFWEDGRRRSSRRRFRPLEHWRGERLLHGRIHDSLATVIGVKYLREDGLKVESWVPAEYADLVAQVAR